MINEYYNPRSILLFTTPSRTIGMCKIPEHHFQEHIKILISCWNRQGCWQRALCCRGKAGLGFVIVVFAKLKWLYLCLYGLAVKFHFINWIWIPGYRSGSRSQSIRYRYEFVMPTYQKLDEQPNVYDSNSRKLFTSDIVLCD